MSERLLSASLAALFSAAVLLSVAGCSGSSAGISDSDIVKALDLERSGSDYAIGGDPFCRVSQLLKSSDQVSQAAEGGKKGLLIASKHGNVGIKVVPPFAPDCRNHAETALNHLDRPNKD
jgi:hypothetical protein